MKIRFYSAVLFTVFLLILAMPTTLFAREFSDIGTDFWAKDAIMEMSDKNIVVGYIDGSFKPEKEIKKVEALILLSRITGVNSEENKDIADKALIDYKDQLSQYNTYAAREISYLLYKNIIKQNELNIFLGDENDEKSILRYQVVPLIIRVMGKEEELAGKDIALLTYKDAEAIPQEIRTYVEYLGEVGLMGTATDDNQFMPNNPMTRAQIATLASRIIKKQEQENAVKLNNNAKQLSGPIISILKDVPILRRTITISAEVNEGKKDIEIPINRRAKIIINGEKATISSIKSGDFAYIEINEKGEAISITIESKDKIIIGVIKKTDIDNNIVYVNVNGETLSYDISDAQIIKNNTKTGIKNINKEDNIIIFLEYNVVKKIQLTSIQKHIEGIINEIVISKNPRISIINSEGNFETFNFSKIVKFNILNKEGDIYGLRLGAKVSIILNENEIVEVTAYAQ